MSRRWIVMLCGLLWSSRAAFAVIIGGVQTVELGTLTSKYEFSTYLSNQAQTHKYMFRVQKSGMCTFYIREDSINVFLSSTMMNMSVYRYDGQNEVNLSIAIGFSTCNLGASKQVDIYCEAGKDYCYLITAQDSHPYTVKIIPASGGTTTYAVSYKKGLYGSGENASDTKTKGKALTLRGAIFTRSGYTQTGWSKSENGSSKDYALGGSYTTDAAVTLYPYWTVSAISKPNLVFSKNLTATTGWPKAVYLGATSSSTVKTTEFGAGDPIYLYCAYLNDGSASTGRGFKILHQVLNSSSAVIRELETETEAKGPGYGGYWGGKALSILQGLPVGTYTYRCRLDSGSVVYESNEDDNVATRTFTVIEPPPVLSILGPSSVSSGMSGTYECIVGFYDRIEKVSATWKISSGGEYATMAGGTLQAGVTLTAHPVTIKAKYAYKGVTYSVKKNISILAGVTLAQALGNDYLTFKTGGDSPWFGLAEGVAGIGEAARSGALGHSQTNYLKTTVTGPGCISFDWYASCEGYTKDYDRLAFLIDGVMAEKIKGTNNVVTSVNCEIPEGEHKLKWCYSKDSNGSWGEDCGYVANVQYVQYPLVQFREANVTVSEKEEYVDLVVKCRRPKGKMRPYNVKTSGIVYCDDATVSFSTVDGSGTEAADAFAGEDYEATSGTFNWSKEGDESDRIIRVRLLPELIAGYRGNRRFRVKLAPRGGFLDFTAIGSNDVCTVKIKEKDACLPGKVRLTVLEQTVMCGDAVIAKVERIGGDDGLLSVKVKTKNDTAMDGVEYDSVIKELVWNDGENEPKFVSVSTRVFRSDEPKRFRLKVTEISPAEIETPNVYVMIAPRPPAVTKKSFVVTGPGVFTAVPYGSDGSPVKCKFDGGAYRVLGPGEVNLEIPAGSHTVTFKLANAEGNELLFMPQLKGLEYRMLALNEAGYVKVDAVGALVDSKGREPLAVERYDLGRGVWQRVRIPGLAADDVVALVGGSLPKGLSLTEDGRGICGTPAKAKEYASVFRVMSGTNRKRVVLLEFRVQDSGRALGTYCGFLSRSASTAGVPDDFGWFKFTAGVDGVSAKATIGGVKYKFTAPGLDGYAEEWPAVSIATAQGELMVGNGLAKVNVYGLGEYVATIHRDDSDQASTGERLGNAVGYYTVALVPDSVDYGNGYLTLMISESGTVQYSGRLPDGLDFTGSSVVSLKDGEIVMPLYAAVAPSAVGGHLHIDRARGPFFTSGSEMVWHALSGETIALSPQGGFYNTLFNLYRYYLDAGDCEFNLNAENVEDTRLTIGRDGLSGEAATIKSVTLDRPTGLISGKLYDKQGVKRKFYGVHLMNVDPVQNTWGLFATGYYLQQIGDWTDTVRWEMR